MVLFEVMVVFSFVVLVAICGGCTFVTGKATVETCREQGLVHLTTMLAGFSTFMLAVCTAGIAYFAIWAAFAAFGIYL